MPKKRIFSTWFHFACIVVLYAILAALIGQKITLPQTLLSFIGWDSVGNSNWYIFDILCLYLITYISFSIFGKKQNYVLGAYLSLLLIGGGMIGLYITKQSWWYDTVLCYSLGLFYSLWRKKIERFINRNLFVWLLCLFLSATVTVLFTLHPMNIIGMILRK